METGKRIWVESLLNKEEWKQCKQLYPSSYNLPEPPAEFECEFKWRKNMGNYLTPTQIENINTGIDKLMEFTKKQQKEKQTETV
jgi:hypothetical protein